MHPPGERLWGFLLFLLRQLLPAAQHPAKKPTMHGKRKIKQEYGNPKEALGRPLCFDALSRLLFPPDGGGAGSLIRKEKE